ncbi:MFS transporter [Nocardioides bruguierae]|uniref:MFS transporter n=1 Tax=Nocardioides bruguierae TaxID=2945102 RepID=A0A9X2IGK8_9ACTN|nr:MFS transporter [Nocardioides bruguierae]MCM0620890.1 MFS transporter [Nocardioides bruguierae]
MLLLGTETDAPPGIAGLGLSVVLGAQFVGRMLGDPLTDRFGRERVAAAGGLLVAGGSLAVVLTPAYPVAFAGFALAGLGCATLVPAAFAAAGRVPGLPQGTGIAVVGWLMRLGFLLTSPAVGLLSDATRSRPGTNEQAPHPVGAGPVLFFAGPGSPS